MFASRVPLWGPPPLPEFLRAQLDSRGLTGDDAPDCARRLSRSPAPAEAASLFVDLGSCKFLEGDLDGAVAAWRHAIASAFDEPAARALLNSGLLYAQLHLHDRAIGVLQSVIDRDVEDFIASAVMAQARCHQSQGNSEQAMESMARLAHAVMSEQPDSADLAPIFFGLGELAADANRFDRAERAWRVASASAPSSAQQAASDALIQLFIDQGHDDELVDLLNVQPATASPTGAAMLVDHAEALNRRGKGEQARALAESISGGDLTTNDRLRLADFRLQLGLVNEAIDEFEVLLADPVAEVHQRAAFSLGEVYRSHDMAQVAISMYQRVIDDPDRYWSPQAALALGDVHHDAGDHGTATIYWTQAASAPIAAVRSAAKQRLQAPVKSPSGSGAAPGDIDSDTSVQSIVSAGEPVRAEEVLAVDPPARAPAEDREASATPAQRVKQVQIVSLDELEAAEAAHTTKTAAPADVDGPVEVDEVVEVEQAADVVEAVEVDEVVAVDEAIEQADTAPDDADDPTTFPEPVDSDAGRNSKPVDVRAIELEPVASKVVAEPIVVALDAFEDDESQSNATQSDDHLVVAFETPADVVVVEPAPVQQPKQKPRASTFVSQLNSPRDATTVPNPYAALAPDGHDDDVAPSTRNPYAELAPEFAGDDFEPASDVEPGDWESMLDDWPKAEPERSERGPKKRSSAFSRYT